MAQIYICDICGKEGADLNTFTTMTIQKYPSRPLELYLCEDRCWKLFRLFWKEQDKKIVEEYIKKDQDSE